MQIVAFFVVYNLTLVKNLSYINEVFNSHLNQLPLHVSPAMPLLAKTRLPRDNPYNVAA